MKNYTTAQTEAAIADVLNTDRTHFGFDQEQFNENFHQLMNDDTLTIGSYFNQTVDLGHCQRYLRTVTPWDLVCEFFHWSGKCAHLLTREAFNAIGSIASGFEMDHDWSFIRDCDDQERAAIYLTLCLHIRTKRLASKTTRAIKGMN